MKVVFALRKKFKFKGQDLNININTPVVLIALQHGRCYEEEDQDSYAAYHGKASVRVEVA
jgi:hypothetical protein